MLRRVGVVTAMVVLVALPGLAEGLWMKANDSNPLDNGEPLPTFSGKRGVRGIKIVFSIS